MVKYTGKLGTVADGLITITKFDTGQKLSHLVYNVKVLCAVGDFGNGTFDLPQKPDRSTDAQLTTIAPIAQNTCYWLPFFHDKTLWAEYN